MKDFMDDNFLLNNIFAEELYHSYAKKMPIIDYHCHLNPSEIEEDKTYKNITEIWLGGDHYKWRLMRACGIDEKFITGDANDKEKFYKWAETVPKCIGNPLYHWAHLELQRYFGINEILSPKTSEIIWEKANEVLQTLSVHKILQKFNVQVLCTTDDPVDNLEKHLKIKASKKINTAVLPSFRPDKYINIDKVGYRNVIENLPCSIGYEINSLERLKMALKERALYFELAGCSISDHGLEDLPYIECNDGTADIIFKKSLKGEIISEKESNAFKSNIMIYLGQLYAELGWVMQLHFGVMRNVNFKMFSKLGPDTGFDAVGTYDISIGLAKYMNALNNKGRLPKTVLYTINPTFNETFSTIAGCFSEQIRGKIQFGTAWWFNDHIDGMKRHLVTLASTSVLGNFIGMLTDSRSFLSYTRHEYFRRLFCSLIGNWIVDGELPKDIEYLSKLVEDVCYNNAVNYFDFNKNITRG